MAEKLCELRKKGGGGGKYTETSLWTNPSPNVAFAAQTVTLSDSISNYKYVAIYYKYAGTTDGVNDPMSVIVPVDKFKTSLKNSSTRHNILVLGTETNGNAGWTRNVFYASDTTIEFDTGYRQNAASSSGDICVPTEILGLNELDHGHKMNETILWSNSNPTTNFSAQSITLSDDIDNYDFIGVRYYYNITYNTGDCVSEFLARVSDVKKWTYNTNTRHNAGSFAIQDNGNTVYERTIMYESDTQLRFGSAIQVPGSTQSNGTCLPINIIGYKLS